MMLAAARMNWHSGRMLEPQPTAVVRAFVSYSWSSPTHEAWVINLATRLREDGVDVILDKWDLKPGHDAYQFMESMVTDPTVTKVMMVCDKAYVDKADSRSGGVGTESQIISPELYGNGAQDKYAALMTDEDEAGSAHIPVFYRGRIFVDFRSANNFEEKYEELLRWLIDRPQHVKPKIGTVPESIIEATPVATATQSRARRAEEAIRQGAAGAAGLIREYGDSLINELKASYPQETNEEPFDETIIKAASSMRPYLRQFAELVTTVVRFSEQSKPWERVLDVHEQLGILMYADPELKSYNTHQFDAYKIVAHEAFLSTIALALDEARFDLVETAVKRAYLVRDNNGANLPATSSFSIFSQHVGSLTYRKQRLQLNRLSLFADILKDTYQNGSVPNFEALMQADFVLYLCTTHQKANSKWYPETLVYASDRYSPFSIFARSESLAYFNRLAPVLRVKTIEEFKTRITEINSDTQASQMFNYHGLPVSYLANADHVGKLD